MVPIQLPEFAVDDVKMLVREEIRHQIYVLHDFQRPRLRLIRIRILPPHV